MSETMELVTKQEKANLPQVAAVQLENLMISSQQLNMVFKVAGYYASSSMVPDTYKGNVNNCFVACELAARMNVSPVLVMQNLYIVQGKPSWAGQACKALVDGSGKFEQSEFIIFGEQGTPGWGCYMQAINRKTGKMVKGTAVTWQMANDEGWTQKRGSKWLTMPEQMMKYRAAAFFARTECPEVLMGYQTVEEVQDVKGSDEPEKEKIKISLKGAAE